MSKRNIEIYDTTLRDGNQAVGVAFSVTDKIKVIELLDNMGIDYIEGGWPGANPKDVELFQYMKTKKLRNSVLTAFGCTRKAGVEAEKDAILNQLLEAETSVITIFGKSWDFHVEHALCTTPEENLNMIYDSVSYLKSKNRRVFYDAEHFYDGYKNNPEYALKTVESAFKAGAERLILCETNGGCLPSEITEITNAVRKHLPDAVIGIHAHNDGDLAVANSISAIDAGASQVQGTFNGYGERCGNANLCSLIPTLQLKMGYDVLGTGLKNLVYVSRQIHEIANMNKNEYAPYVGRSAFSHKGGVHASGVTRQSSTYEHVDPGHVGNTRRILISDQSGIASIKDKIESKNYDFTIKQEDYKKILSYIKELEWQGYAFEDADASFELMVRKILGVKPKFFDVQGFRVISNTTSDKDLSTEASVKVKVGNEVLHTVSEGDGPGNALDLALRRALRPFYPRIRDFKLIDYKVRILDGADGTSAKTRVHVESSDGYDSWDTVAVSRNIIEATYLSIVDSIDYGLLLRNEKPQNGFQELNDLIKTL
ncbi:MAG: citramalate synthase [Vampirovibrionia bacterium]